MPKVAEIREAIRMFLSNRCHVPITEISGETKLEDELGLDSFDLVALLMEVEDTYGVVITDAEAAGLETVDQAVDLIAARAD